MKNPAFIIVIIVAIASFSAGIMVSPVLFKAGPIGQAGISGVNRTGSFQDGWNAAKKRLMEGGFYGAALSGMETKTVNGQVQAVKDGQLTIKIRPLEPLADPELDIRTVKVGKDTTVVVNKQKEPAVFEREMSEFQEKMKASVPAANPGQAGEQITVPLIPPSFMIEEAIELSAIKAGDIITVTATADIKEAKSFAAARISITQMPTMPNPAPVPPAMTETAPAPVPPAPPAPVSAE